MKPNILYFTKARRLLITLLMLCTVAGYAVEIRPAWVSSMSNGNNDPNGRYLVDEDTDSKTSWTVASFKSAEIVVDVTKQIKLEKIKLRIDPKILGRWKNFSVSGSNDTKGWEELRAFTNQKLSNDGDIYNEFYIGSNKRYRYYQVKVTDVESAYVVKMMSMSDMLFVGDDTPSVYYEEVEIPPTYHNALYYTFDTFSDANDYPWKLVDDYGTSTSWGLGTNKTATQFIIVDAGSVCYLERLKLYAPADDTPKGEKLSIAVYGSKSYQDSWTKLYEVENGEWNNTSAIAHYAEIKSNNQYRFYKIVRLASNTVTKMADLKLVVRRAIGTSVEYANYEKITPVFVSGNGKEALDGKTDTYWIANPNDEIVFDAKRLIDLYGFELYNTPTSEEHPEMQWKDYEIYGKRDENSTWQKIKTYENCFLDTKNSGLGSFNVGPSNTGLYRYFKLKFIGSTGGGVGHVSEIKLVRYKSSGEGVKPIPDMKITRRVLSEDIHNLKTNEIMVVDRDITITGTNRFAPLKAEENGVTLIEFENGATLTLEADSTSRYPGLWIPKNSLVVLKGHGKLIAKGGNGSNAKPGKDGTKGNVSVSDKTKYLSSGKGGDGGNGGDGAAPGIGGVAGWGANGGKGAGETNIKYSGSGNYSSVASGTNGNKGDNGTPSGDLVVMGNITVASSTGMPSVNAADGGNVGGYYQEKSAKGEATDCRLATGGGGGGAGAHGNAPDYAVCAGGGAGGSGGAGGNSGFCSHYYAAADLTNSLYRYYNSKSAGRGGRGGAGYNSILGKNGYR